MIIVLACDVPLAENNGTAVAGMNLKRALEKKGHTVRLLCPDALGAARPGAYAAPAIDFGPLDRYVHRNGVVIARPSSEVVRRALSGADHLHIMTPFFLCGTAVRQAKRQGVTVTAGFHCQAENLSNHFFLMDARGVSRRIYRVFWRHIYRRVDGIHYPTQFIRDVFEDAVGRETPGEVISNGVGAEFFPADEEKPDELRGRFVILFTGRYSREKTHELLIRAAARSRHREEIRLIFAGDGPRRAYLERLSGKLLPAMPVMGFVQRDELIRKIRYADLYVHPAKIEIEAIACLEAIRGGLVPVVSDSERSATGAFALWEENTFRCGDAQSLADRIDWWIEHPETIAACRAEYEGFAARFDRDACMDRMERFLYRTWEAKHEAEENTVLP